MSMGLCPMRASRAQQPRYPKPLANTQYPKPLAGPQRCLGSGYFDNVRERNFLLLLCWDAGIVKGKQRETGI